MSKEIAPIVIDLGRVSRKRIRALKEGSGQLVHDISEVMDRVRIELSGAVPSESLTAGNEELERELRALGYIK